jgi:hypothetical protein
MEGHSIRLALRGVDARGRRRSPIRAMNSTRATRLPRRTQRFSRYNRRCAAPNSGEIVGDRVDIVRHELRYLTNLGQITGSSQSDGPKICAMYSQQVQ